MRDVAVGGLVSLAHRDARDDRLLIEMHIESGSNIVHCDHFPRSNDARLKRLSITLLSAQVDPRFALLIIRGQQVASIGVDALQADEIVECLGVEGQTG